MSDPLKPIAKARDVIERRATERVLVKGIDRGGRRGAGLSTADIAPASRAAAGGSATELAALRSDCWVYDIIYTPRPTQLLQSAAARGCRSLDGLEMLVQQGAAALRLWSGRDDVPVAVMRQALLEQLP